MNDSSSIYVEFQSEMIILIKISLIYEFISVKNGFIE